MLVRTLGKLAPLSLLVCVSGCVRDAAAEEPIKVQPGMYEAELTAGFGPISLGASESERRSCVTPDETEHFPQVFTRKYLSMDGECEGRLSERRGNLVTGELVCRGDEDQSLNLKYAATVSEDAVDVAIKGNLVGSPEALEHASSAPAKLMRAMKLGVKIKRVGDC